MTDHHQQSEAAFGARTELRRLGVSEAEIQRLITGYPLERIARQLRWLRLRKVWKASAFIVAAISHDYEAPAALFEEAALNSPQTAATAISSDPLPEQKPEDDDQD